MNENAFRLPGALAIALLFATSLALAKTETTEVDITHLSRVGTIQSLKPGSYLIEVMLSQKTPEVLFYRDGKPVAKTAATIVEEPQKNDVTEVELDTRNQKFDVITEIRPAGWKERIEFPDLS